MADLPRNLALAREMHSEAKSMLPSMMMVQLDTVPRKPIPRLPLFPHAVVSPVSEAMVESKRVLTIERDSHRSRPTRSRALSTQLPTRIKKTLECPSRDVKNLRLLSLDQVK